MNISGPFIRRPVATSLLAVALLLGGIAGYRLLPVAPIPEVDFPTISVSAGLPGASPETMASAVATPLERQFGRIAGLSEMTSVSSLGSTSVVLQFDLSRDINAAARDVQAAINAARSQLPANLPGNPNYRKANPADAPIMILALTSDRLPIGTLYDAADSILAQRIAQVEGIGQVFVGGSSRPAIRVEANPKVLDSYGIGLEQLRSVLAAVNVFRPKGRVAGPQSEWSVGANDQLLKAGQYKPLIVGYQNGAPVRLSDVADVVDSVEDVHTGGTANGQRAILLIIFRQPGANIIQAVDSVTAILPELRASISPAIHLAVTLDRTQTIRASVHDVEITLMISVVLVVLVVFAFLRDAWATFIPSVAVPLSLVGTFGVMYLLGYSIDNLSLMALTISTGFVVDDAIVVIENITRYLESGVDAFHAALIGAREIGFTVLSMSTSLIAVFLPILLMQGIVGRLFREFAVSLSIAVLLSLLISLTVTPALCARFLRPENERTHGFLYRIFERGFAGMHGAYGISLKWVLDNQALVLTITALTLALNIYLFVVIPKGFFPQQDMGRIMGMVQASQDISFNALRQKQDQFARIVMNDPGVDAVESFVGGGFGGSSVNTGRMFIALKPLSVRKVTADQIIARLRPKTSHIAGARLFLQAIQDINVGGHGTSAQYQYTLEDQDLKELNHWAPRLMAQLQTLPELRDVGTDQQSHGLQTSLEINRDTASRLGITPQVIDNTLYDAFGQRQVSTIYTALNQYHVVLEAAPPFQQNPDALKAIFVRSNTGEEVPLSAFAHFEESTATLTVNHLGQFPAVTLSFNLAPGVALGQAVDAIQQVQSQIRMPATLHASFQGTAQAFQVSLANEPLLVLAALAAVYIVLGILYESYIHPITILSTLPSAGVGAILALLLFHMELSVIALVGIILLIGIVKKNAIMMIDFALMAEREEGKSPVDAIYEACLLRFRPILMTTMAAMLGALPLAVSKGMGSEFRRPLGVAIVGGLILSQALTLFTTPVVYLFFDRIASYFRRDSSHGRIPRTEPAGRPA
ncbi:MAG TPA: multidrug efflux RND transporter permease subunit [Terriglobia bacterium]|nr:multidrug efflux RND transporter permease subunit [Terriglobia bacterium]